MLPDDGFTGEDRKNLTNVCRDVKWMKHQYEKRMDDIEERQYSGEQRLHTRVDEVHGRVSKIKLISGVFVAAGSAIGSFFAWITTKGGS